MRNRGDLTPVEPKVRVNNKITATKLRVVSPDLVQLGILDRSEALKKAEEFGLDLVEVSPKADPPVCKIMDYGKFRYEETKKEHDRRKKQTKIVIKEVKLSPKTEAHDVLHKSRQICGFLSDNCKVKITVRFKGREMAHPEQGKSILNNIFEIVQTQAQVEQPPKFEGRNLTMVLSPQGMKVANASVD